MKITIIEKGRHEYGPFGFNLFIVAAVEGLGRIEAIRQGGTMMWAFRERPHLTKEALSEIDSAFDKEVA